MNPRSPEWPRTMLGVSTPWPELIGVRFEQKDTACAHESVFPSCRWRRGESVDGIKRLASRWTDVVAYAAPQAHTRWSRCREERPAMDQIGIDVHKGKNILR